MSAVSADAKVASLASQGLFDPATLTLDEMRAICAAALMRVPDHRQRGLQRHDRSTSRYSAKQGSAGEVAKAA